MREVPSAKAALIMAYYVYFGVLTKRGELQGIKPAPVSELLKMSVKSLKAAVAALKAKLRLF